MHASRFALLLLVAPTAFAHHSAAMFDVTLEVVIAARSFRYECRRLRRPTAETASRPGVPGND